MGAPKTSDKARDAFHAHLDACAQCREHPFKLCAVGAPLLEQAGAELGAGEQVWPPLDEEGFPF